MEMADNNTKITWQEFKKLCEQAGVSESDEIDFIDVSWGAPTELSCEFDEDFGWRISLGEN
ncbi:MAG: hypothetical protein OEY38_09420 [Gammaproteobacteria bacterium]|nr:hypothetical protein [Gammaproteobacteria bacterium]